MTEVYSHVGHIEGELELAPLPDHQAVEEDMPQSWSGSLSDTNFTARFESGFWILGVKVEAERPVLIQNNYVDTSTLQIHAEMFDFALAFARGDRFEKDVVGTNAMGLVYAMSFFGQTGQNLRHQVDAHRKKIEINQESLKELRSTRVSADVLIRIAKRIEDRMTDFIGYDMVKHLKTSPNSSRSS
jgi:hypothetical protein